MVFKRSTKTSALVLFFCLMSGMALALEKPISVRISGLGGYDNNTGLNADRKGDGFAQENMAVLYQRLLHKKAQMRLSYSVLNNNYFDATDQNILAHSAVAALNFLLTPQTVLENSYSFDYLDFPHNSQASSYSNEIRVGLRQRIGSRWVVKGGLSASKRDYVEKKLRQANGFLSPDERSDIRYILNFLAMFKWRKNVVLNVGAVNYRNDSNDFFHDYYDYKAYKFFTGASWEINPKLSSYIKFIYEKRAYDARLLIDFPETFQKDDIYTANISLFYKLKPDLSLGAIYTYRQKNSNEPSQKYSGSTDTLGLYYSF